MRTGTYYSLKESGSELWSQLELGIDRAGLVEYALRRWDGEQDEIEAGVAGLLDDLLSEELVVEVAGQNGARAAVGGTGARAFHRYAGLHARRSVARRRR
jgi:hypothetical protein